MGKPKGGGKRGQGGKRGDGEGVKGRVLQLQESRGQPSDAAWLCDGRVWHRKFKKSLVCRAGTGEGGEGNGGGGEKEGGAG